MKIKQIVILGGGTAGWITAGILAKKHASAVSIVLIESSEVPTVGVGEGTWPTMRSTLKKIGISETEFLIRCQATFKQGSHFVNWTTADEDRAYSHPFTEPQGFSKIDIAAYWSQQNKNDFASSVTFQTQLCKAGLAPKGIANKEFEAVANYGYHLDAGAFAELLKEHCVDKLQVKHIVDHVVVAEQDTQGNISQLQTKQHGAVAGDLFIDCSGFACELLGNTLGVPFVPQNHQLFADSALATHVPYSHEDDPIACQTISTAHEAGWTWDIGLQQRRGVGYVYSSQYSTDEQAEKVLANYIGSKQSLSVRKISFQSGHREVFWKNNCVAIGLSAGFLEPLEASALMLVETSANFIADQLPPCKSHMHYSAKRFNHMLLHKWQGVIDFLKLHYVLSKRQEPFWQDNRSKASIPDSLTELLDVWKFRSPNEYDFPDVSAAFSAASYSYILYGSGFDTDYSLQPQLYKNHKMANRQFALNTRNIAQYQYQLPRHRELINKVKECGFPII